MIDFMSLSALYSASGGVAFEALPPLDLQIVCSHLSFFGYSVAERQLLVLHLLPVVTHWIAYHLVGV